VLDIVFYKQKLTTGQFSLSHLTLAHPIFIASIIYCTGIMARMELCSEYG